jgi:hypothetical protein
MLSDLEIIERCLLIFSKPGRWTTKTRARDRDGKPVSPFAKEARSFDLEGAIRRSAGGQHWEVYSRWVRWTAPAHDKPSVPIGPLSLQTPSHRNPFDWNDAPGRTQQDVIRVLEDLADTHRYQEVA